MATSKNGFVALACFACALISSPGAAAAAEAAGTVLWEDRIASGVDQVNAVAMNSRYVALGGDHITAVCAGCPGQDASLRVYDTKSGQLLWKDYFDLRATLERTLDVGVAGDVVLSTGHSIGRNTSGRYWWFTSAHDARTGKLLWRDVIQDPSQDSYPFHIAVSQKRAIVAGLAGATCATLDSTSCDQFVRAYDVDSGEILWTQRFDRTGGDDEFLTIAASGARVFAGGTAGFGAGNEAVDGYIAALDARTGELLWEDRIADSYGVGIVFKVAVRDGIVVAAGAIDRDVLVRAYDAESGRVLWTQTWSELGVAASEVNDNAVQLTIGDGVVAIAGYGSTKAFGEERYFRSSRDWMVAAYDAGTGALLWRDVRGVPDDVDEANGGVVIAEGQVVALGLVSQPGATPCVNLRCARTLVRSYDLRSGALRWEDLYSDVGFPFGVTVTLGTAAGRVTAASFFSLPPGTPLPAPFNRNTTVRTYSLGGNGGDVGER